VWVGPALGDEVTVPAQQGGRLDEAPSLAKAREQSHQAGQHGPVGRLQRRTADLASEYRDLVAQHDDLDCEVAVLAAEEPDQLEDANERLVQEREGHRRMLAASGADVKVQLRAHGWRSRHPHVDLFERAGCDVHGGQEMNHMALNVDASDTTLVVAGLSEAGVDAFEVTPRHSVFISDPDGHRIEILPISASERAHEREHARTSRPTIEQRNRAPSPVRHERRPDWVLLRPLQKNLRGCASIDDVEDEPDPTVLSSTYADPVRSDLYQ
jgi:catechol 2,3-dioxygenase-like lactoylglutathione lyase family enzyme